MFSGGHSAADAGSGTLLDERVDGTALPIAPARSTITLAARDLTPAAARPAAPAPRRSRISGYAFALVLVDALAVFGAGLIALLAAGEGTAGRADVVFAALLPIAWVIATSGNGGYERRYVGAGNAEFGRVFRSFAYVTVATVFLSYLTLAHLSRSVAVPALALALGLALVGRYLARKVLHRRHKAGLALAPVVAVGDAESVAEFAALLRRDQYVGMSVAGACLVGALEPGSAVARRLADLGVRDLGGIESIADVVGEFDNPTVAVLSGSVGPARLRRIASELDGTRASVAVSPGLAELGGRRMHVEPVAGLPLLHIEEPRFTGFRQVVKTAFDISAASLSLLVLSPFLLLIGVVIRATSPGPALFRQTRVGRNGREFTMWKFRSMCVDAENRRAEYIGTDDGNGVLFKLRDDPRVTRVGRVLRRISLDELPQLINVVTGSMSLVGPRPPLPVEVEQYHDEAHRRLVVKPGLTGLWQISGRSNLSWEESIRLDLRYVEDWSLSLDLVVLWKTLRAVIRADGAY